MTVQVELLSAFACEDVRIEFNGQMTFVGSISSRFGAETFPIASSIYVVAIAKVSGSGLAEIEFSTVHSERGHLLTGGLGVEVNVDDDGALFVLGPILGGVPSAGQVVLNWRMKGEEAWHRLKAWDIIQVKPPTDSDAPPEFKYGHG